MRKNLRTPRTRVLLLFLCSLCQAGHGAPSRIVSDLFQGSLADLNAGNASAAAAKLKELVAVEPRNGLYWFNLGVAEYSQNLLPQAQQSFAKVIALGSPLAPAAEFYQAKTLARLGELELARSQLVAVLNRQVPPTLKSEAQGGLAEIDLAIDRESLALRAFQDGHYAQAAQLLKSTEYLSVDGRVLLGLSLARQERFSAAQQALEPLVKQGWIGVEKRDEVESLLGKFRESGMAEPYWLSFDFAAGWTNNSFVDGQSVTPAPGPLWETSISIGKTFFRKPKWTVKVGYLFNHDDPTAAPELRLTSHTVELPAVYRERYFESMLIPYFQLQDWNGTLVAQKNGASWKNTLSDSTFEWGANIDVSQTQAQDPSVSYLTGTSYGARPFFGYWWDTFYLQIFASLGKDGTQDIYYGDGSSLPLTHRYVGGGLRGIWKPSQSLAFFFNLSELEKNFANPSLPNGKIRTDLTRDFSLKAVYFLKSTLSLYALGAWTANTSTLTAGDVRDKNYDLYTFLLGFSWSLH
ncbi:MAG: hypothetical protein C5B49_04275 [Bdellovibrio sp.]|nr:MAG: hypothetical protein C5B49_04275 [Bdellovibrio sp.]